MKPLASFLLFGLICATSTNAQNVNLKGLDLQTNSSDISGNYAIVGVPFYANDSTENKTGATFIYYKDATSWKVQAKLTAPDADNCKFYGAAVAIYGDYCVVSAVQKTIDKQAKQGKIYIYKRSGTAWNLEATKISTVDNEQFGYSVDISANSDDMPVIAIGAPNANNGQGQVYTYVKNNNTWNSLQTIAPKDLTANNKFGSCVSIDKDCLAVGAPNQDYAVYDIIAAGAVYVFTLADHSFYQQQKLVGYYPNGQFGNTLSLYGNKMAIGSPSANSYGSSSSTASVVVLTKTDNKWNDTFSGFNIPDYGKNPNGLGMQLSLNDGQLLIGNPIGILLPAENPAILGSNTLAYLYATSDGGTTYHLKETITANQSNSNLLGHNIALDSSHK